MTGFVSAGDFDVIAWNEGEGSLQRYDNSGDIVWSVAAGAWNNNTGLQLGADGLLYKLSQYGAAYSIKRIQRYNAETGTSMEANFVIADTGTSGIVGGAKWDFGSDYNSDGVSDIVMIGTGATAVQLIPELSDTVRNMDVYQRTPIWI